MINLMDADRKWPRPEARDALRDAGWTMFSIGAALILLPAIGIKALSRAVVPARERETEMTPYLEAAAVGCRTSFCARRGPEGRASFS